ncbi:MAG: tail fiber assembly protein [Sodalis sp. (in: enterobacteria)]
MATKDEKELYDEWRKYRVMLNRVNTSKTTNITWPNKPNQS